MSKETLRNNLHSAQSLAAGTEACQGIAKLDINKLTADQLKQVLQVRFDDGSTYNISIIVIPIRGIYVYMLCVYMHI